MSRTHFAFFLARRPTKLGSPRLAEKLRWGSYFGESSAQKPPQARAAKQPSNPQKRLRDGLLRGEEPVTKAPHDLPSLGHFRESRVRKGCYGTDRALLRSGRDERYNPERQSSSGKKRAVKGALRMKNAYEVLRQKELEVSRLKREVEALRVAAPLLSEGEDAGNDKKPRLATNAPGPRTPSS